MRHRELSYVNEQDPAWRRLLLGALEDVSGRRRVLAIYRRWRNTPSASGQLSWDKLLNQVGTRLDVEAPAAFPRALPKPLIIVANHPFGIPDGVALMALAERIERPYRILVHSDLMRIPEVAAIGLPVDFAGTRDAAQINLRTRAAARAILDKTGTLIIFPAGGVATAEAVFGKAEDLVWKPFVARLVRQTNAHVLPVHFEGQNSPLFQFVSRYSVSLRLALIVSEARRHINTTIKVRVGAPVSAGDLMRCGDDKALLDELYLCVHRLAPDAAGCTDGALAPRPARARRRFAWEIDPSS